MRSVRLNLQEKRLQALTNMIKEKRQPDPRMYQSMFKSQLKPMQESMALVSPGMRFKQRQSNDELNSLFSESFMSESRAKS